VKWKDEKWSERRRRRRRRREGRKFEEDSKILFDWNSDLNI
jgi:hypothetical protein